MNAEMSNEMRNEMKKITRVMHKALDEDGSTHKSFHQFLKDLWAKVDAATHAPTFLG